MTADAGERFGDRRARAQRIIPRLVPQLVVPLHESLDPLAGAERDHVHAMPCCEFDAVFVARAVPERRVGGL